MRDLARDAHFAVESLEQPLIARGFLRQKLEGDRLTQHEVRGAIDLAHAAAAEESEDAIAAGQECAGDEAPFVDKGRGG